jgi:hypothetical protein
MGVERLPHHTDPSPWLLATADQLIMKELDPIADQFMNINDEEKAV